MDGRVVHTPPASYTYTHTQTPRPKWEVLSVLNYVVLTIFIASITFTGFNYRRYFQPDEITGTHSHNIFPLLVLWCICMVSKSQKCVLSIKDISPSIHCALQVQQSRLTYVYMYVCMRVMSLLSISLTSYQRLISLASLGSVSSTKTPWLA